MPKNIGKEVARNLRKNEKVLYRPVDYVVE